MVRCIRTLFQLLPCSVFVAALSLSALDVPLTYMDYSDNIQGYRPYGTARPGLKKKQPPGEWKLPSFTCAQPVFCAMEFGETEVLFALDDKAGTGFYDTLYFDADGNRDLTDDEVLKSGSVSASPSSSYRNAYFPVINTAVKRGGREVPYSFRPRIYCYMRNREKPVWDSENWQNLSFYLRVHCAYKGILRHEGKSYTIFLGDRNVNGRFDDVLNDTGSRYSSGALSVTGDNLYISDSENVSSYDRFVLGDMILVGRTLFTVSVKTGESRVELTPVKTPLKKLALAAKPERLTLYTKDKKHCIMMYRPEKTVSLPPGDYRFFQYEFLTDKKKDDIWRLQATATNETPFVTVGDKAAELAFGEPFVPGVMIPEYSLAQFKQQSEGSLRLSLKITGAGNGVVTYLSRIGGTKTTIEMSKKSTRYPKEPHYAVIDGKGEIVGEGDFDYG